MHGNLVSDRIFWARADQRMSGTWGAMFALSLDSGARMVEARDGYPPAKLTIGGLIVWALVLGAMAVGNDAPVLLR